MNRDDLMRISRALAKFRPSFLVLIMNLTEEDLIFMEKCIQRTLLVSQQNGELPRSHPTLFSIGRNTRN
jgi:hypothetical protein